MALAVAASKGGGAGPATLFAPCPGTQRLGVDHGNVHIDGCDGTTGIGTCSHWRR